MQRTAALMALLFFCLTATELMAKSTAKGGASINGNRVSFEFTGDSMVNVSSSVKNGKYEITAVIDGTEHDISVTEKKIAWNDKSTTISGFKTIDIRIDGDQSEFIVDGNTVDLK